MNNETGGPAFPFIDSASPLEHSGMTLRDYFAAQAVEGICTNSALGNWSAKIIAREAYEIADAMMEARK